MLDKMKKEKLGFFAAVVFLLCYFMLFFDFPNLLTVLFGSAICLVLLIKQEKLRLDVGTILLSVTIVSYFFIRYGFENAIVLGLPYVGILMYVLANYLSCELKTKEESEKLLFIIFFAVVLGYTIHGILNSYMYLAGYRTEGRRHWYDFWMNIYLPATEQVIYFLPVLSLIFPAIVYFRKNRLLNIFVMLSSLFFVYISWISDSRMSIFIFPLVFGAQCILYILIEWKKVKNYILERKTVFAVLAILFIVGVLMFVLTDNPIMNVLKTKLGRDGGVFGSERFVAQKLALTQLFVYPMGGSQMDFGRISYAHNTWLDMANRAGLVPFFAFSAYTFWTVYEMIVWLTKKEISTRRKLTVAGVYGAFFLYYTVERGIDNSMHFMTPWFFVNGMVHGELSAIKENK